MKESQPIPAIAVSLATSWVAAPYLLIRNYYQKSPLSLKGALYDFLMLWGLEDWIELPTLVSFVPNLSPFHNQKVSFIA